MLLARGGGTFRAQVLSFRRLAALIGREVGFLQGDLVKPMEDVARVVLLEDVVRAEKQKLQIFAGVAERPGFVQKLDATLRELRQHGHTGESVREMVTRADAVTGRKLQDLALLLEAWGAVMDRRDAWDFEKILHHAALRMGESRMICGGADGERAQVWVDGFSAMSALELRMLVALAEHADQLTVTLMADPDAGAIRDLRCALGGAGERGLFARTERLYCRMVDLFRKHRVAVSGTEHLREGYRFRSEGLRRVERELFDRGGEFNTKDTKSTKDRKGKKEEGARGGAGLFDDLFSTASAVEIWECSDPETEVRVAAQAIRQMAIGNSAEARLRYREIGVIVPDLEGYQDAVRRIFSEHGIPHFIDQRRGIAHHPVVELLRSAVAIVTSRWDRDEVLLFLKTGLTGISGEDVAVVENYVIEHGISRVPWSVGWKWFAPNQKEEEDVDVVMAEHERELLAHVNGVRGRVWEMLREWVEICASADGRGMLAVDFIEGLRKLLVGLKVEEQIAAWVVAGRGGTQGDVELAQVHEQVWRQVQEMLEVVAGATAGRERTMEELVRILGTALETLTLGLIPPTVDQVLVSSVTRSRVPELRAVMILGAVEGKFPKVVEEDPILSDGQRAFFNGQTADPIGAGSDRQLLEMRFFDYGALTRASELLVVSYPLADGRGRAMGRSRYVGRLVELFGEEMLVKRAFDAGSRTSVERIGTVGDLLAGVAGWVRGRIGGATEGDGRMRALYNWVVTTKEPAIAEARELVWAAVRERGAPQLGAELAERFYPAVRDLRMSVSQLEKFAACPLQYFMHYTLRLRPRAVLEMDTLNLGLLYHRILERVFLRVLEGKLAWPECEAHTLRQALGEEVAAATKELHAELAEQTPGYEKMLARTRRVLGIVLEGQRRRACAGEMRPVGVEVGFGGIGDEGQTGKRVVSLPVLRIGTPGGRGVGLMGKIDRVDAAGGAGGAGRRPVMVVDYKSSSSRELKLDWVYWGLQLQLPVYAIVMEELGKVAGGKAEAVAAMYVPLGLKRETVKRAADAEVAETDAFYQKQRPRGLVDAAGGHLLDQVVAPHEDAGGRATGTRSGSTRTGLCRSRGTWWRTRIFGRCWSLCGGRSGGWWMIWRRGRLRRRRIGRRRNRRAMSVIFSVCVRSTG